MDFDTQLIIALIVAGSLCTFLDVKLTRSYKKQGKSIKYLQVQIIFGVGTPIMAIPALLSDVIPLWAKIVGFFSVSIVSCLQLASLISARKSFRKILGLPPEDEHTGEIIKEEDKKKDD